MIQVIWESIFRFPIYATFQWADKIVSVTSFKHADTRLISHSTNLLLRVISRQYMAQAIFAFLALAYATITALMGRNMVNGPDSRINFPVARIVVISGAFISTSYMFSILFGGPDWMNNERPDQIVQFLPMFLLVIFLLPFTIKTSEKMGKIINWISLFSLLLFCITNLLCGFLIIRDHLQYHGNILSEADVPLVNKMDALDFIANDWKEHSDSDTIPVDYDLGGGEWDWVPKFGTALTQWYPAPMTMGRSFDYELLREYGLKNQQEGIQLRTFGSGRYLVTYAFEDPPVVKNGKIVNYIFGRLRVSIVER